MTTTPAADTYEWAWIENEWQAVRTVLRINGEHTVVTLADPPVAHNVWPRHIRRGDKPSEPPAA